MKSLFLTVVGLMLSVSVMNAQKYEVEKVTRTKEVEKKTTKKSKKKGHSWRNAMQKEKDTEVSNKKFAKSQQQSSSKSKSKNTQDLSKAHQSRMKRLGVTAKKEKKTKDDGES